MRAAGGRRGTATAAAGLLLLVPAGGSHAQHPALPPVRIDFETFPDGSPACDACPAGDRFAALGVRFAFAGRGVRGAQPWVVRSGAYDPPGEEENHSLTSPLTRAGLVAGVLTVRFAAPAARVEFRLRGSDIVRRFAVRAWDAEGRPVPEVAISRAETARYVAGRGGMFRGERISVRVPAGVIRLELDGRGPPGHILLLDDLVFWP